MLVLGVMFKSSVIKGPDEIEAAHMVVPPPAPIAASSPRAVVTMKASATIIPDLPPSPEPKEESSAAEEELDEEGSDGEDELALQYVERHVDFADLEMDADAAEKESKLRRRDTPHHLKNKRINIGSADPDSAEEKVRAILAQAATTVQGGSMDETSPCSEEVGVSCSLI